MQRDLCCLFEDSLRLIYAYANAQCCSIANGIARRDLETCIEPVALMLNDRITLWLHF